MNPFLEVSILFGIATILAFFMRRFRLPLLVSYLLTGLIAGPLCLGFIQPGEQLHVFSELGVAALLFVIGLTLSPGVLSEIGSTALKVGVGQCLLTAIPAFFLARVLGFDLTASLYIATGLTLSSTIVVSKILSDQKSLGSLHGKISIGFLLVQDVVAAFALLVSTSLQRGEGAMGLGVSLVKTLGLFAALYILGKWLLPRLTSAFAASQDVLFLFSLGWGMGIAGAFYAVGLSLELGALAAGVALASSPYHHEMSSRMRVVRDFFLVVFFALLGVQAATPLTGSIWGIVVIFSLFVMFIKPMLVMGLMAVLGFQRKTSFLVGISIGQISEFSLILLSLGLGFGHLSAASMSMMAFVGIISMAGSSFLLVRAEDLYVKVEKWLRWLPSPTRTRFQTTVPLSAPRVVLIGCHRFGGELLPLIQKWRQPYVVIDFDPGIIRALQDRGVPALYGDASDGDFLEEINVSEADIVISSIPETGVSRAILAKVRKGKQSALTILAANGTEQALRLYQEGATCVINLHDVAGRYASLILETCKDDRERFAVERRKHLTRLRQRERRQLLPSSDLHHRWTTLH